MRTRGMCNGGARTFRGRVTAGLGLLGLLLAAPGWPQGGGTWIQVPTANVEGLEEAVVRQLEALREHVAGRVADNQTTAVELAEAIGELGRHYHAYQLAEPAEECYTIARRLAPGDFRWPYLLGYLYQTGGRLEEAVEQYQRALAIVPDVPPALIRLGRAYLGLDRPTDAEQVLLRALELDPSAAAALESLGQVYLATERHTEAAAVLERALELEPAADLLYYPLGQAYRAVGELEKARAALAKRGEVGLRPADPVVDEIEKLATGERVHLLRGRAAFEARRFAEAVEEFRAAVEADPESVRARVNLASALTEVEEVDEAIGHLETVVEIAPGNATAWFNLGVLRLGRGELELAATSFAEAVGYQRNDAEMRLRLADTLRRLGRIDETLPHYGKAVALDPGLEVAWLGEAESLVALGRFEEAITRLETAHKLMPTSGQIAQGLARLLAASPDPALRDGERALTLALRVVKARPTLLNVQTVAMAHAELGQCDEAAKWQSQALEASREAGNTQQAAVLEMVLESYQAGPPCRPPIPE